ncbi:MAG: efflux RND transporter periplasmic adaptor subunit [Polyangia bacterium]
MFRSIPWMLSSTLLVCAGAGVGAGGCGGKPKEVPTTVPAGQAWLTPSQIKDSKLEVSPVSMHDVGGAIVTSGRVTFDDLRVSHVFSPVSGRITKILVDPGQRVKKDQPLCVIQSPDIGQAFSDLAKARADADAADKDFRRQKELVEAHAGAQKDLETAKATLDKARAELDRSQRKARMLGHSGADEVTQEFQLRSSIEGEVVVRNVSLGGEVQGTYSGGAAVELFTIGELDRVWVQADVFEIDLGKIKEKSHVSVKVVSYPNRLFEGVVDYVSETLDPVSRTAKVRISVDNKDRLLKPEMYATVQIAIDQRKAIAIPRTAVIHLGEQTVVFAQIGTAPDGRLQFERRPVAVDEEQGGDYLPVTHGLKEGDRIVSAGAILLLGML